MKTTQEIYEALLAGVKERCGLEADDSCDLAVRLYAAAAQLESLYAYADWSRKQCFPQSASGEYLDRHAELRGLSRRAGSYAAGTLTLSLSAALSFDLTVPADTLFCVPEGAFFRLTQACTIPAGSTSGSAPAQCTELGTAGNVGAGEITGLVDPPAYISAVGNAAAFTGGRPPERDEQLRTRLLQACRALPNGANGDYYEALALHQEGITSAAAIPAHFGSGTVGLCLSGNYGNPTDTQMDAVRSALSDRTELGLTLYLLTPQTQTVNVSLKVWPVDGISGAQAIAAAKAAIEELFEAPLLRQGFLRSQAGSRIYNTGLVKNYEFLAPAQDAPPSPQILYTLGSLSVTEGS